MKLEIDLASGLPLYKQIEIAIRQQIQNQELKIGQLIPSEKELEAILGISRAPIRQAIGRLVNDGYLVRRSGKGTFISAAYSIRRELPRLNSFTEEMRAQGINPTSRVLSVGIIKRSDSNSWIFDQLRDDRIFKISRLRYVAKTPVCILQSYIPARVGIQEDDDYTGSLYELLERKYKLSIISGEERITAAIANSHDAKLLGIPKGSPILSIRRITVSTKQVPIEVVEGSYRADRFYFAVRLQRESGMSAQKLFHTNRTLTANR